MTPECHQTPLELARAGGRLIRRVTMRGAGMAGPDLAPWRGETMATQDMNFDELWRRFMGADVTPNANPAKEE